MSTEIIVGAEPEGAQPASGGNWFGSTFAALRRSKTGFIGFIVFMVMCIGCVIGPWLVNPQAGTNPNLVYATPSWSHLLGTDNVGGDIFRQIVAGGRDVVIIGLLSAVISTAIAATFGALAAYKGGATDGLTLQVADFFLTIPQFPLLVVMSAYLQLNNVIELAVLLGVLNWPALLRAVRAQVLSLKEREYVEAARLGNLGTGWIIFREILPNMASYLMINFILGMTSAVYALAGLYLLGLAPMSGTNWGIMINQAWVNGALFFPAAMWSILSPLIAISILQLSAIWFVRSLEEILNPRLRGEG